MKNKKIIVSLILAITLTIFLLVLDLLTKHFIIQLIPNVGDAIDVIPNFINFVYVKNTGAAWGMLAGRPIFLIIASIIILAVYLWFFISRIKKFKDKTSIALGISVGFITGGCLGNLVDRIVLGYVRDFINFEFMQFPVFNFADIALTVGVILMLIYFIFIFKQEDEILKREIINSTFNQSSKNLLKNKYNNESFLIKSNKKFKKSSKKISKTFKGDDHDR